MSILIKTVRIAGFRGLKNFEINLSPITVLTGMNNTGKTSFLKAIQLIFGNKHFVSQDDFYISGNTNFNRIVIDAKIIAINEEENQTESFSEDWEILFSDERIKLEDEDNIIPLRTIVSFDEIRSSFKTKKYILPDWPKYFDDENNTSWENTENGNEKRFVFEELPFFYIDAQRDIIEDIKVKNSYLGRMISKIEYNEEAAEKIEQQIKELNEEAVNNSDILKNIKDTLKQLDSAMNTSSEGVEITPFTKKLRDLSKGLSIYYSDKEDSFSMEYHGMGTRSWSSLLTLKSFISLLAEKSEDTPFYPILALEEPEAHLHPNAQKKLYHQLNEISGQKIISTHSPYITACAELNEIRNFYKTEDNVSCGFINTDLLSSEDERKIRRQVINTRGELFFSKVIIFFEGETEEQALPIFVQKHFGKTAIEMAIDFVGVGGAGNYLPFIRVAEGLKTPWFILSDGETKIKKELKKTLKKLYNKESIDLDNEQNIFVLPDDCDIEKYLIQDGYLDEIKLAFKKLHSETYLEDWINDNHGGTRRRTRTSEICPECNQNIYQDLVRNYDGDEGFKEAVYDCMTKQKTKFGPVIADIIVESDKNIPTIITDLFNKVNEVI